VARSRLAVDRRHAKVQRVCATRVDLWQMHALNEKEEVDRIFGPGGAIEAFEGA